MRANPKDVTRAIVWALVLGGVGAVGFRALGNAQPDSAIDSTASRIACEELSTCSPGEETPVESDFNAFRRFYRYETATGQVDVTCRWELLMFGSVRCAGERKPDPRRQPELSGQYPHKVGRGQVD